MPSTFTEVRHLKSLVGESVALRGWVRNARTSKTRFIELRDGSGFVQCVVGAQDADAESYETAGKLTQESAISLTGLVQQHPKTGEPEILVKTLSLLAPSVDFPITPKDHGIEFLMDHRTLWLRSKRQWAIIRVRHTIVKAIRDFFDEDGFTLLDAPILTPSSCEGTSS
ncbi:MAG: asparagine--tRNA ligase, partial [Acidobacteriota bacterium]|nr:asparagine--tRNA ligase [Acidobacteriota bacterium]